MYKSPYIEMNEHGIDLVRNYRTYKHIEFSEIKSVYCKKGHLIRNWGFSLVMGIGLVIFCLRWGITSALAFNPLDIPFYATRAFIAYHIIIPWLLLTGGAFLIVQALRKSPVIVMNTNSKKYAIALKEFEKEGTFEGFIDFLAERTKVEGGIKMKKSKI